MPIYNGEIELSDTAVSATEKGLHEYVGIIKDGRTAVYLQLEPLPGPSIIYKDWRGGHWSGTVMSYISSLGVPQTMLGIWLNGLRCNFL